MRNLSRFNIFPALKDGDFPSSVSGIEPLTLESS